MKHRAIWIVVVLVNLVALFCAINPWITEWRAAGIAFFVIEAILVVTISLPVVPLQRFKRRCSWGESFTVAAQALMDMITGFVP